MPPCPRCPEGLFSHTPRKKAGTTSHTHMPEKWPLRQPLPTQQHLRNTSTMWGPECALRNTPLHHTRWQVLSPPGVRSNCRCPETPRHEQEPGNGLRLALWRRAHKSCAHVSWVRTRCQDDPPAAHRRRCGRPASTHGSAPEQRGAPSASAIFLFTSRTASAASTCAGRRAAQGTCIRQAHARHAAGDLACTWWG